MKVNRSNRLVMVGAVCLTGFILTAACNLPGLLSRAKAPVGTPAGSQAGVSATLASDAITPLPSNSSTSGDPGQGELITPENAANLRQVAVTSLHNPFGLNWSMDGHILGAVTQEGLMMFISPRLTVTNNVQIQSPVTLLDFASASHMMATTSDQKTIDLRSIVTGQVTHTLQPSSSFSAAVFSPDGMTLAVPATDQIAVDLWNVMEGTRIKTLQGFQTAAPVYGISFSKDGRNFIWVSRADVQVMVIQTGEMGAFLTHEDFVGGVALAPDGRTLAVATSGTVNNQPEPFIQLWNAFSGKDLGKIPSGEYITSALEFSNDGRVLVGGRNSTAVLWDVANLKEIKVLGGNSDRVNSLAFSPDGKTLATASADGSLRLWQTMP